MCELSIPVTTTAWEKIRRLSRWIRGILPVATRWRQRGNTQSWTMNSSWQQSGSTAIEMNRRTSGSWTGPWDLFIDCHYIYHRKHSRTHQWMLGSRGAREDRDQGERSPRPGPRRAGWGEGRSSALDGTCGALREEERNMPIAWPHSVEWCNTDVYNYSISCTFLNLQLQILLHYYGKLRCRQNRMLKIIKVVEYHDLITSLRYSDSTDIPMTLQ